MCLFGALRNLSATLPSIQTNFIATMRPERLHIVTNDNGYERFLPQEEKETQTSAPKGTREKIRRAPNVIAQAKADFFNHHFHLLLVQRKVKVARFMAVMDRLAEMLHGCRTCRGVFMKEMCRVSILSDVRAPPGATSWRSVELVFITRPDAIPRMPVFLTPYQDGHRVESVRRAGIPIGQYQSYLSVTKKMQGRRKLPPIGASSPFRPFH